MPIARESTSAMAAYLKPKIKSFMKQNSDAAGGATVDDGVEAIAQAIAYGMALAWSSDLMKAAFVTGVVPLPVPPSPTTIGNPIFGQTIHAALAPSLIEL